jgi:hypothetical protein
MAQFIVSYDLKTTHPDPHDEFLRQAQKLHWGQWLIFPGNHEKKLPDNTLVSRFKAMHEADVNLEEVARNTSAALGVEVKLKKGVIIEVADSLAWTDETN